MTLYVCAESSTKPGDGAKQALWSAGLRELSPCQALPVAFRHMA